MNIGGRIVKRLKELNWDRRDLLDRVPDLTPQALSNLINRDSVRSEWDERIADALGVSVLWLVYDRDSDETPPIQPPAKEHQKLISGFNTADQTARDTMLWLAERALSRKTKTSPLVESSEFQPKVPVPDEKLTTLTKKLAKTK